MKRISFILIVSLAMGLKLSSQNIDDALRYSQIFYTGSSRSISMGGAFTALGGDLSAIGMNPAGTGIFRSFEFSFTPQLQYNNTKADFNGTSSDSRYNFGLNNIGAVTNIYSSGNETGLVSLNAAYSFTRTNNFNTNITIKGISTNSSMADYWAAESEGTYYKNLRNSEGIAFDAYVIDTLPGSGAKHYATTFSGYGANTYSTYGQTIRRIITNDGYSGEHAFSIGGNYSDKFFFGATLGISTLSYTGHYEHLEADYSDVVYDFKNFTYTDHFEANGTGYSFKLGAIIKPVEFLKVGLALHSPTVYRIHEYFNDKITSYFDNGDKYDSANDALRYSYSLTTPFRVLTGVAVQIKKLAIISADYEYVDYTMARFSKAETDYNFYAENNDVQKIFKSASNLRFGAEFRFNTLYLRGGYSYYGKAFKAGEENEKTDYSALSLGIGFRQQNFYFDMALSALMNSQKYIMYSDPGYLPATTINSTRNMFSATIGFKF